MIDRRQSHCATSTDSQRATGLNKHHERRPPGLMGGASAKHDPAVTPIITEDSNPLSDRGHHLPPHLYRPKRPLREKTTRAYGRSKRQPCFTNHLSKTQTFCPTMQPSCVLTTDTPISPLLQSQAQECKYHPYPKRLEPFSRQWDSART